MVLYKRVIQLSLDDPNGAYWRNYYNLLVKQVLIILIGNFGQDSTFAGLETGGSAGASDDNGFGDFYYTHSGYLALCSSNLPEPTISPNADTQADKSF